MFENPPPVVNIDPESTEQASSANGEHCIGNPLIFIEQTGS